MIEWIVIIGGALSAFAASAWLVVEALLRLQPHVRQGRRPNGPPPSRRVVTAATGETVRLRCCASPDYPPGTVCCINCGRPV